MGLIVAEIASNSKLFYIFLDNLRLLKPAGLDALQGARRPSTGAYHKR